MTAKPFTLGDLRAQTDQLPDHYQIVLEQDGYTVPTAFVGIGFGPSPDNPQPGEVILKAVDN